MQLRVGRSLLQGVNFRYYGFDLVDFLFAIHSLLVTDCALRSELHSLLLHHNNLISEQLDLLVCFTQFSLQLNIAFFQMCSLNRLSLLILNFINLYYTLITIQYFTSSRNHLSDTKPTLFHTLFYILIRYGQWLLTYLSDRWTSLVLVISFRCTLRYSICCSPDQLIFAIVNL